VKYRCVVVDHDDTAVESTPHVHYPAYLETMSLLRPHLEPENLEGFFLKNFRPGFMSYLRDELRLTDEELATEIEIWHRHMAGDGSQFYPGFLELLQEFHAAGGMVAVASHSDAAAIARDYRRASGGSFEPDFIFGWNSDPDKRKPSPYPVAELLSRTGLTPEDVVVVDDLSPGVIMAEKAGVHAIAAGWAHQIEEIAAFMKSRCVAYLTEVESLRTFLL